MHRSNLDEGTIENRIMLPPELYEAWKQDSFSEQTTDVKCPSKGINLLFPSAEKLVIIPAVDGELPPWSMSMLSFDSAADRKGDAVFEQAARS
jgi:hypothetical protein